MKNFDQADNQKIRNTNQAAGPRPLGLRLQWPMHSPIQWTRRASRQLQNRSAVVPLGRHGLLGQRLPSRAAGITTALGVLLALSVQAQTPNSRPLPPSTTAVSPVENGVVTATPAQGTVNPAGHITLMPLSLSQAVDQARAKNPSLRESREKINQYEEQIPFVRSAILPNLSLLNTAGYHKDASSTPSARFGGDPYNLYETDLHLTQPVFQVGMFSAISSAEKDRDMRKLETEAARRDLSNSVIAAYYSVTLYSRNVETLIRQQNIVRESLNTALSRERTGRGQLLDVLQVRTQIALLDPQISTAKNQLQTAVANLSYLLGNVDAQEVRIKSELSVPELAEVDRHVDLKNTHLPEIEKDRIATAQIQDQKRIALGQNLPNISLTADYIYEATKKSDLLDESSESYAAGLQLTIPIFSGLSSIYQQRTLASQETQLEIDQVSLHNQFSTQQVTARKQLETAEDSIRSGTEALKLAIATSNEAKRNYRLATIDFLQFLTVQQAYVQAEQALNLSKYNYIVALGNYFVASGQELDVLIELLERSQKL